MKEKKKSENVIKDSKSVITNDGELLSVEEKITIPVGEEPPYIKYYRQDISKVVGLSPAEQSVWSALIGMMGYKTNIVVLIKPIKEELVKITGKKYETVKAAIKALTEKRFLIPKARSVYLVDPHLAASGSWEDIKAMRLEIEYNEQGRNITIMKVNKKVIEIEENRPKQLTFLNYDGEIIDPTPEDEIPFPNAEK